MSDEKPMAEGECLGVDFVVESDWRFFVPDLNRHFKCYEDMRESIERNQKTVVAAKKRKLSISAVDSKGKKYLVTGVHSGHGKVLTQPAITGYGRQNVYFDTPLISAALAEKRRLDFDLAKVEKLLDFHKVKSHDGYSFNPSQHESCVVAIEKGHAKALAIADKPLLEVLAGIKAKPIEFD